MYKNEKGDWAKAKKIADELIVRAKVQAELESDRVKNFLKLTDLALELYKTIPAYDSLFYDSPLAPTKIRFHLNAFAKKLGMSGVKDIVFNVQEIKPFEDYLKDAVKWAFKFQTNEKAS
jgi:hypothetical protein